MKYDQWTIKEAITAIDSNDVVLPALQRRFVWEHEDIEKLFDSLMREYPIGTFLFWEVEKIRQADYTFYKFLHHYHERDNYLNDIAGVGLKDKLIAVLDGQQRLSSMYVALQSTYAYKAKGAWRKNETAYPTRQFYLNVFKPEEVVDDDDGMLYGFRFLTDKEANAPPTGDACWCLVKELLTAADMPEVNDYWDDKWSRLPSELRSDLAIKRRGGKLLVRLWQRIAHDKLVNFATLKNQNLDEILDVFVRVNGAGTPLSKTDLLFSTVVAHWKKGREEIEGFLKTLNRKGDGFRFDSDFAMRAALVLTDASVRLRVGSFKPANVKRIVDEWESVTKHVDGAVDLLVAWGLSGTALSSTNAVIPIAYALKCGAKKRKESDLRLLLLKSLLKNSFTQSSDQALTDFRGAMMASVQPGSDFDIGAFEAELPVTRRETLRMDEEVLDETLRTTIGGSSFLVLALLSPELKIDQVQFHQDHIHPHGGFEDADFRTLNLPDEQVRDWRERRDMLPNLQLLEGRENKAKKKVPFTQWLDKEYPGTKRTPFLESRHIPASPISLDLRDFDTFFEARRTLLKSKLAKLLGIQIPAS